MFYITIAKLHNVHIAVFVSGTDYFKLHHVNFTISHYRNPAISIFTSVYGEQYHDDLDINAFISIRADYDCYHSYSDSAFPVFDSIYGKQNYNSLKIDVFISHYDNLFALIFFKANSEHLHVDIPVYIYIFAAYFDNLTAFVFDAAIFAQRYGDLPTIISITAWIK
ncbi:MAG: hypothetical protein Q9165_003881 [Trypethelium subeluteriae]